MRSGADHIHTEKQVGSLTEHISAQLGSRPNARSFPDTDRLPGADSGPDRRRFPGWLIPAIPAVISLLANLWKITTPSYWRDEAVTADVARRPLGGIFHMLGNIDAVHSVYYLLMHFVAAVLGTGELSLRLPSALAVAGTAAVTAALGRRLATPRVGLTAGLMFAILFPVMARFAQEARSYALATAIAVIATYLFVRALERGDRRAFTAYGVAVAAVGLVHLFTLLLLAAHVVTLWTVRSERALLRRWVVAVGVGVLTAVPLAALALPQRDQVEWIVKPTWNDVYGFLQSALGTEKLIAPMLIMILFGLLGGRFEGRFGGRFGARRPLSAVSSSGRIDLRWLALPWLLVPPVLLMGLSLVHPFYLFRYVLYCIPAAALLAALGISRIRLRWAVPIGVVLALVVLPNQQAVRKPTARADDLRKLGSILEKHERPGDAIVFRNAAYRRVTAAYPRAYTELRDVELQSPSTSTHDLMGREFTDPAARLQRFADVKRAWFVDNHVGYKVRANPLDARSAHLMGPSTDFIQTGHWQFRGGTVYLYERS
jgi:mannosyltransferase